MLVTAHKNYSIIYADAVDTHVLTHTINVDNYYTCQNLFYICRS